MFETEQGLIRQILKMPVKSFWKNLEKSFQKFLQIFTTVSGILNYIILEKTEDYRILGPMAGFQGNRYSEIYRAFIVAYTAAS